LLGRQPDRSADQADPNDGKRLDAHLASGES